MPSAVSAVGVSHRCTLGPSQAGSTRGECEDADTGPRCRTLAATSCRRAAWTQEGVSCVGVFEEEVGGSSQTNEDGSTFQFLPEASLERDGSLWTSLGQERSPRPLRAERRRRVRRCRRPRDPGKEPSAVGCVAKPKGKHELRKPCQKADVRVRQRDGCSQVGRKEWELLVRENRRASQGLCFRARWMVAPRVTDRQGR